MLFFSRTEVETFDLKFEASLASLALQSESHDPSERITLMQRDRSQDQIQNVINM